MAMSWVAEARQKSASASQSRVESADGSLRPTVSRQAAMTASAAPIQWRRAPKRSTAGDQSTLSDQARVRPEYRPSAVRETPALRNSTGQTST